MPIPDTLYAGNSATWTEETPDKSATDSYVLTYELSNAEEAFSISGAAIVGAATTHTVTITPAISGDWIAGEYHWRAYASKTGEKWLISEGTLSVIPDISGTEHDGRSHVKIVLDAIELTLQGKAPADVSSLSIEGRSISRYSPAELIAWRSRYQEFYRQEQDAARIASGAGTRSRILTRFVNP